MIRETIQHFYNEDREHLDQLLIEFDRAKGNDVAAARQIFAEYQERLNQHICWEEECLFPIFERIALSAECGLEALRAEHAEVRALLLRIEDLLEAGDPHFANEELILRHILTPHTEKEELMLYPFLDEALTDREREDLFAQMRSVRERFQPLAG